MKSTQNEKISQIKFSTLVVGIDVAKETHYARAFDFRGIELSKLLRFSNTAEGFQRLEEWMQNICQQHSKTDIIVGFEPTGHYWFTLGDYLKNQGHKLAMVNPFHVKRTKELDDNSPTKNDRKDPKTIAMLVKDGRYREVYIPEDVYQELREVVSERDRLVQRMSSISNQVTRWLDIHFPEFSTIFKDWRRQAALQILRNYPTPGKIVDAGAVKIEGTWKLTMKRTAGLKRAQELVKAAEKSIGRKTGIEMIFGSKPVDNGNFILTNEERNDLISLYPIAKNWIRPYIGAHEFINNISRWCLWLNGVTPKDIHNCKPVMERINAVKKFRLQSKKQPTVKSAQTPALFAEIRQPDTSYILIPAHSSEKRRYIPAGFIDKNVIASNAVQMIPNATLYHFGVLTSNIHMAWMRAVCGRIKSDYRYSAAVVYNNFPWPDPNEKQKEEIEKLAQTVLEARLIFPDSSLADLYDPLTMPQELVKAHNNLDRAVIAAYGGKNLKTEAEIVSFLMERYQQLIGKIKK